MFNAENERRLAWQLGFLIVFWSVASFTFVVQEYHLPAPVGDLATRMAMERWGRPDPWRFHPYEYDPYNDRETLIEACVIWIGYMYGMFRLINIYRIFREDDQEALWNDFWRLCE